MINRDSKVNKTRIICEQDPKNLFEDSLDLSKLKLDIEELPWQQLVSMFHKPVIKPS